MVTHQARKHLVDFEIATDERYTPNWHHEVTASALEAVERGEINRLIIEQPPRHGKSRQASIDFPAWFLGRNPDKQIITASYSGDLATDFGSKTRDLVSSEQYQAIFKTRLHPDERSKAKWVTNKGGSYISVGVGGPTTGRGAHIFIIDDPIKNREEAESETYRSKTWDWYTSTAYTRLEKGGAIILILTRWHMDDLAGRILEQDKDVKEWTIIRLPAIAEEDEEYRKKGEALWPDKYPLEELERTKRVIGQYEFSALFQQTPISSELQEFKPYWFKERDESIFDTASRLDAQRTRNFLTVDTAISKSAYADSTGLCDNAVDSQNYWNLRAWRAKLDPKELIDLLFTLHAKRNYEKIGIEKTIYLDTLKPFLDEEQRKRQRFLPIVELKHGQTAKELRIRGLIPLYESGSIFHIKDQCKDLEEELLNFPVGVNDDVMDATAYQLQIVTNEESSQITQYRPSYLRHKR